MFGRPDCLVDLGHTRVKWACSRGGRLLAGTSGASSLDDWSTFDKYLSDHSGGRLWMSGQSNPDILERFDRLVDQRGLSLQRVLTGEIELPVPPAYSTLGSDRWLALQWPWLETGSAVCVVDCGTAVTIDLIDTGGIHQGGWIMAGLATLQTGLLEKARGLPRHRESVDDPSSPARDSSQAITAGTQLQLIGAIDRAIAESMRHLGADPEVWLTGGDADAVLGHLRVPLRHDPLLVLRGLALAAEAS